MVSAGSNSKTKKINFLYWKELYFKEQTELSNSFLSRRL